MFFIIDRFMISAIIFLGMIVLLIIFDNQNIPDNELVIPAPPKKKSFLTAFFRNMAEFFNYLVPGAFGKLLSLVIMTALFFILTFFDFTAGVKFWLAVPGGLFISFVYLKYRSWLSSQQKQLLYSHWNVVEKKGHYTSGNAPHIGEVALALNEKTAVRVPAGLFTPTKAEHTPVVVKKVTGAGNLIVEMESGSEERFETRPLYRTGGVLALVRNAWDAVKKTFLSVK